MPLFLAWLPLFLAWQSLFLARQFLSLKETHPCCLIHPWCLVAFNVQHCNWNGGPWRRSWKLKFHKNRHWNEAVIIEINTYRVLNHTLSPCHTYATTYLQLLTTEFKYACNSGSASSVKLKVNTHRYIIKRIFHGVIVRIGKVEPEGEPVRSWPKKKPRYSRTRTHNPSIRTPTRLPLHGKTYIHRVLYTLLLSYIQQAVLCCRVYSMRNGRVWIRIHLKASILYSAVFAYFSFLSARQSLCKWNQP